MPQDQRLGWLVAASICLSSPATASPFGAANRLNEDQLRDVRGGFDLPNGMNVAVAVQIESQVDGALALRTVFTLVDTLQPGVVQPASAAPVSIVQLPAPITTDPGGPTPQAQAQAIPTLAEQGLEIRAGSGSVRVEQNTNGRVVILASPSLEIRHLTGSLTGVVVANTMDNRVINTEAAVSITLRNSAIPVTNSMISTNSIGSQFVGPHLF